MGISTLSGILPSENPLESLGRLYYIMIFVALLWNGLAAYGLFYLGHAASKTIQTDNVAYLVIGIRTVSCTSLISGIISLAFGFLESYYLWKAGDYSGIERLSLVGGIFLFVAVFSLLFLIVTIELLQQIANVLITGRLEILERIASSTIILNVFEIIISILTFIGTILYLLFLHQIGSSYEMQSANNALTIKIIQIIFAMLLGAVTAGSSYIRHPMRAITEGVGTIIGCVFTTTFYYYVSNTFLQLGEYYSNVKRDPSVIDRALEELEQLTEPVKISTFIRDKKIPYEVFIKRLEEELAKGNIKGSLVKDTFYPFKKEGKTSSG
ncbi:MAG: hypothetical protein ACTSX9_02615 [Candidatus Njordarchaeales archaeon]